MALDVLCSADNAPIAQLPKHDLKSFFYILLCFCLQHDGPEGRKAALQASPVDRWFVTNETFEDMALWKISALFKIEERIFPSIPPYFQDLVPCLRSLFDVIFEPLSHTSGNMVSTTRTFTSNVATHSAMLGVLEATLDKLPIVKDPPPPPPAGKGPAKSNNLVYVLNTSTSGRSDSHSGSNPPRSAGATRKTPRSDDVSVMSGSGTASGRSGSRSGANKSRKVGVTGRSSRSHDVGVEGSGSGDGSPSASRSSHSRDVNGGSGGDCGPSASKRRKNNA